MNLHWPRRAEALQRGCTCSWFGTRSIVEFDSDCPILTEHRQPGEDFKVSDTPATDPAETADTPTAAPHNSKEIA